MTTPVIYDISIGKHKPHSGTQTSCPFCHRETLTDILDEKGDIIWLMNKYPVFRNTYPTVIIESAVHEDRENFLGTIFHEDENCFASLSSYPICGMGELNVTLKTDGCTDTFADTIQKIANYILHDFPIPCNSYNLFFYHMKHIHVKLFPRYIASPLYMGYRITHVMDDESSKNIISMLTSPKYFG